MARINFNKNKQSNKPKSNVIPDGFYELRCEKAVVKSTYANGTNEPTSNEDPVKQLLTIHCIVETGFFKGSKVYARFNTINPNARAVAISSNLLSDLCDAIGIFDLEDTQQLVDKFFCAEIRIKPASKFFPEHNDIFKYHKGDTQNFFENKNSGISEIMDDIEFDFSK